MKAPTSSHAQILGALHQLTVAIVSAVDAGGEFGADGGTLFVGLSSQDCTIRQFQDIMGTLVAIGALCRVGDRYYLGDLGLAMVRAESQTKGGAVPA